MKSALLAAAVGVIVALPFIFRRLRWLRIVSILMLLGFAGFAWTGVVASPRLAIEMAGLTSWQPEDRFVQGAFAARDLAISMQLPFWGAVVGLAVLALLPGRVQR